MPTTPTYQPFTFDSDGATLRGRLYRPSRPPIAVVVMGHGFSATVPMTLDKFAERFAEAGLAAFAFDHRGHGASDGEPRGEINYWVQARGFSDAIGAVRAIPGFDALPLAVWSDSMSARIALGVAALDDRVGALVCQVPALGDRLGRDDPDGSRLAAIGTFLESGTLRGSPDTWSTSAVVSADQATNPSALKPLTAFRWFIEYGGRYGSGWTNRVVFTGPGDAPDFDPIACAARVRVPTMFAMSPDDEMPGAVSAVARSVFERLAGPKTLVEVAGGHFGIIEYPSAAFDHASGAQADWLVHTLGRPGAR